MNPTVCGEAQPRPGEALRSAAAEEGAGAVAAGAHASGSARTLNQQVEVGVVAVLALRALVLGHSRDADTRTSCCRAVSAKGSATLGLAQRLALALVDSLIADEAWPA